jgi:uncharacterized protein
VGGLRQYSIPFRGLKEGRHDFEFVADNSFFEQFDSPEIEKGIVRIHVELVKHSQFLELHFSLTGREVLILADSASEVRLEQFIYEYIHLALPYQRIHPEVGGHSGCDPEMMEKLEAHAAHRESDVKDPRWEKLKGLIDNTE